jgi:hypothetical protein
MTFPQINETQLRTLQQACLNDMMTVMLIADPKLDTPEHYELRAANNTEVEYLHSLGLFDDITDVSVPMVEDMRQKTGRKFRIFIISEQGRALFDASISHSIN